MNKVTWPEYPAGRFMSVIEWLSVYRLPTGRRLFAFRDIKKVAIGLMDPPIQDLVNTAVTHDENTYLAEMRYAALPRADRYDPEMAEVDQLADECLGGINASLEGVRGGRRAKDPIYQLSVKTQKSIFPNGLGAVTLLAYPMQLEAMKAILRLMDNDLAAAIAPLHLDDKRQLLGALTAEYEEVLKRPQPGRADFSKVREMRNQGLEYLARVVVRILDRYGENTPDQNTKRSQLLAPLEEQQAQIQKALKARRGPIMDINPDTGEDVEPVAPVPA